MQTQRRVFLPLSSFPISSTSRLPAPDLFNFNLIPQTQQHYVQHRGFESEFSSWCKVALLNVTKDLRTSQSNSKTQSTTSRAGSLSSPILFPSFIFRFSDANSISTPPRTSRHFGRSEFDLGVECFGRTR